MPIIVPPSSSSTSAPQTVATQQVFDYLLDTAGHPKSGATVIAVLNYAPAVTLNPVTSLQAIQQQTTTDSNGYYSFNLIPNGNINPSGTTYTIIAPDTTLDISVPTTGGPFQVTAITTSQPATITPATTGLVGPITVTGDETVTGNLTVSGTSTLGATTVGTLTTSGAETVGGDLTINSPGRLVMKAAASKIVPGATSLSLRNNADGADNLILTDAGAATIRNGLTVAAGGAAITGTGSISGDTTLAARLLMSAAAAKIVGGATSLSHRNNADSADNLLLTDAGLATLRNALSLPPSAGGTVASSNYGSLFVKIAEGQLGAPATSFPSVSLPSGFRSLLLIGRYQGNAGTANVGLQFNGDTTNNYSFLQVFQSGGGPSGGAATISNFAQVGQTNNTSSAVWFAFVGDYNNTTLTNRPVLGGSAASIILILRAAYWNQANALTSLVVTADANMATASYYEVFGIP